MYENRPVRFFERLGDASGGPHGPEAFCAGFEGGKWRCKPLAFHLAEWLPDYALPEEELRVTHANSLLKLNEAAVRVYTSQKYQKRGEAGEIALHAVCREFFGTIPISPRVFYKSASNDPVKAFDMVHVRFPDTGDLEIWLGESKLYADSASAISEAIASVRQHVEGGFLSNQKMLLGPQVPKTTPRYEEIARIFAKQESLDTLLEASVFVIGILSNSSAAAGAKKICAEYKGKVAEELDALDAAIERSGLKSHINIFLLYVPLASKADLVSEFDKRLKGLQ